MRDDVHDLYSVIVSLHKVESHIKAAQMDMERAILDARAAHAPPEIIDRLQRFERLLYLDEAQVIRSGDGTAWSIRPLVMEVGSLGYARMENDA